MIKMKKLAVSLVLAGSAATASAAVITNPDFLGGTDFGGFDWASNGSVYITGYDILSGGAGRTGEMDLFVLNYQAFASSIQDSAGNNIVAPGLRQGTGTGYEYTINAVINEKTTCLNSDCSLISIDVVDGTWDVLYQAAGNATVGAAGHTGFLDGTNLLSGIFTGGDTIVGAQGPSNPGSITLAGTFMGNTTSTNNTFINPDLDGTIAVSTLQFKNNTTAWTRPNNWDGIGGIGADTNTAFVGQADANQSFVNAVPEPGSIALLGIGLGAAGMLRRRNDK